MFKKYATHATHAAFAGLAASAMIAGTGAVGAPSSYINQVVLTDGGHRIGNAEAKVSVMEFVSYTCK